MASKNNLGRTDILALRESIESLESTIAIIYKTRTPRDLTGPEGILTRTLGNTFQGPENYQLQYFDQRRAKKVDTEFAEVIEALEIYDRDPTKDNEIELLLEVGDILFQQAIIGLKHTEDTDYTLAQELFGLALNYITGELHDRRLSFQKAQELVKIKYGARAWLGTNGYDPKDKALERQLCLNTYST
jgi:hypothetical protein